MKNITQRLFTKQFIILFIIFAIIILVFLVTTRVRENVNQSNVAVTTPYYLDISPAGAAPAIIYKDGEEVARADYERFLIPDSFEGQYTIESSGFIPAEFDVPSDVSGNITVSLEVDSNSVEGAFIDGLPADESVLIDNGVWVNKAVYFENKSWLVGELTTANQRTNGELVILKKAGNGWEIVYAGTGPNIFELESDGVPASILAAIEKGDF